MHKRKQIKEPEKIERETFVTEIMKLGLFNELAPNTIVSAVQIADRYIDECSKDYSLELVHISTVIACKYLEDWNSYNSTFEASDDVENHIVYDMEWEICCLYNFCFPINNILTYIVQPIINLLMDGKKMLGSDFYWLVDTLCRKKELLSADPATVLIALKLLSIKL